MAEGLSAGALATLSLLDPEQGVCPNGHRCQLLAATGERRCSAREYVGDALICWDVTAEAIEQAALFGALGRVVELARLFLSDRP